MLEEHGILYMLCSSQIISEMLPETYTVEMCYFLKSEIPSKNIFQLLKISSFVKKNAED